MKMKKLILLWLVIIFTIGGLQAQNANRSGAFVELGVGGYVGSTPRSEIGIIDNQLMVKCLTGGAFSIGTGYRLKFSPHWAYEVKAEAQTAFNDPVNGLVGRFLPISFRYTSAELWRNYSLYGHINLGAAIAVQSGEYVDYHQSEIPVNSYVKLKGYWGEERLGPAYSLGVGVNLTTHLYVEGCFNGQVLISAWGKHSKGVLSYGTVGVAVGYRF